MKKKTFIRLILFLLIILISAILFFNTWNKPHQNLEDVAGIKISATELYHTFIENEEAALKTYNGKVLTVTGTISAVTMNNDGKQVLVLQSDDPLFGINCSMEQEAAVHETSTVTIKGICTGYTSDVILIRCEVIN